MVLHPNPNQRIHLGTFAAQAFIGTGMGFAGQQLEKRLVESTSRNLAVALYMQSALRMGPRSAYPLGLGLYHLVTKGTEHLMGVTEESLEGTAGNLLEAPAATTSNGPRR